MKKTLLFAFSLLFLAPTLFAQKVDYATQIQPIFTQRCVSCHGGTQGLQLNSYANTMTGSNRGAIVVAGNAEGSILYDKVRLDKTPSFGVRMPQGGSLTQAQVDLIKNWITEGATATDSEDLSVPSRFVLAGNYPNPFNPGTTVSFSSPSTAQIQLTVVNLLGQAVLSKTMTATTGKNSLYLDMSGHASGMYFYRISAKFSAGNLVSQSGSMLLSK